MFLLFLSFMISISSYFHMAFLNNPGLINLISHNMQIPAEKKNYESLKTCWRLPGFKGYLVVETFFFFFFKRNLLSNFEIRNKTLVSGCSTEGKENPFSKFHSLCWCIQLVKMHWAIHLWFVQILLCMLFHNF